jgi:hypothetical protein
MIRRLFFRYVLWGRAYRVLHVAVHRKGAPGWDTSACWVCRVTWRAIEAELPPRTCVADESSCFDPNCPKHAEPSREAEGRDHDDG